MKNLKLIIAVALMLLLLCSTSGFALMVGDAPNPPYGEASHQTAEWQMIGSSNTADDGVWWSTDGGANWGHDSVHVGDQIRFKFELWSAGYGNHTYDQIKSWIDWDQSGDWYNTSIFDPVDPASEVIIADRFFKVATDASGNAIPSSWNISFHDDSSFDDTDRANYNAAHATTTDFLTNDFLITDAMIGEVWLRARAQCWHVPFDTMTPTGNLWQGEVEDWSITVNPAPEPATMLLLGSGLFGLAGFRRKFKK